MLGRVEHSQIRTDSNYFLDDSKVKIASLVVLSVYFYHRNVKKSRVQLRPQSRC